MSETTDLAAAVQAAHDKVTDMCSGSGRWTMSIPVRLDHDHGVVITRALTMQADALAAARREVETVNEEAERQAGVICNLNTDLATSRAALEDVRRVEAWIQAGNAPDLPEHSIAGLVNARYGAIVRWEDEETTVATGDSLEALGRALAKGEG